MENETQNMPQEGIKKENKCAKAKPLWCLTIMGALIIVLIWWWTPAWADIAITVLAALVMVRSLCPKK